MLKPATAPLPTSQPERPGKRSIGRTLGMTVFGLIAGLTVIALVAAGFVVWTIQRSFPQLDGTVAVSGLDRDVVVQRDELGIPTITASGSDDLFFAQGYVHAQDRFWEMDFRRHVTSGRLSELFGASQLQTDSFLRTLGWREVAAAEVAALEPAVASYYEAYADGVNAYLADHDGADASLEYAVLGLQNADYEIEPWTPEDSVAWLKAMAWDLRSNLETESERALLATRLAPEEVAELYPGYPYDRHPVIVPTIATTRSAGAATPAGPGTVTASVEWTEAEGVLAAVSALVGGAGEGIGSNSWVVSGELTETGMPLLANDPHLGAALPSVWHQVTLKCRATTQSCPFDVSGFAFSGVPGVVIGHNSRIAWGFTNLTTDVTDLYLEKVDGDSYWRDGQLVSLQERSETIRVAGGDDVQLRIRSTVNGPIVSGLTPAFDAMAADPMMGTQGVATDPAAPPEGEYAVSLKWTALTPGTTAASIFDLNVAQDFNEFRAAAARFTVPAQNLVYADVDGNIGYQTPGMLPIRGAGDGSLPQPGWDSAYAWQGFIPFEELPTSFNPTAGYIVTANNAIVTDAFPYFLTDDWDYGWRAARIVDLLQRKSAMGELNAEDMREIQADNEFAMGRQLASAYMDIQTGRRGPDAALDLLRSWDAQNSPDSDAAAYANVLWDELVTDLFVAGRDSPAPVTGQSRLFLVVDRLLEDPDAQWWTNAELGIRGRDEMLVYAADRAYDRLVQLQGDNPAKWNWGSLHALSLRNGTFGSSGIAPIEMLFNRGPYRVGGGTSVANATGWNIGGGFETVTVPSMRMVIDLSDFDESGWNHLTGASGHAFHPNYVDQTPTWQRVELTPWAFSDSAVDASTTHTLTLVPAS
ncbi:MULTISPECIES: penicillin acylase family protein [unclassified Microbacterium]|uniref:penicillin acylase family protein n=1 Tax=unclassified Microbacterium TaxID=2609290 RepID=UPI00214AE488|nr:MULTISPECIES: penicillin acylase family protein [unclassified Microbacterium]MCR2808266.1 penicillin acylase family protein [Microbacterium sp. zg.B185]WIM19278.1 penicillin acylase family protein [Microbacterium sp. zg-B185]